MSNPHAIGIDLGGTNVRCAVVDAKGQILHRVEQPTEADRGPNRVIAAIADQVAETIAAAGLNRTDVVGIGLGAPGPLSQRHGLIYNSVHLPGWNNVQIRAELARRTGLDTLLENDANAAAFGEYWAGAGAGGEGDLVMFTLGTGVGGGVIVAGRPLHGHYENAGELGHLVVEVNGHPCECGQRGCLEQYASATNLVRRAREAMQAGRESALKSTGSTLAELTCERIVEAVRDGDPLATEVWDEACRYLAVACVLIQHAFNPARVVFGGGMSQAGPLLIDRIVGHFNDMRWHLMDDFPRITLSALGTDAGVVGAAALVLRQAPGELAISNC
ncbi:MAG: ROK family protein [Planctomycetes bacterium]|nr:ROK family protein [Planctomycetota bacterium]